MTALAEPIPHETFEIGRFTTTLEDLVGKEEAKDHIGLVYSAAMKYCGKMDVEDTDAFGDGCLGLLKAIETHTKARGNFSTWATYLIESAIIDGHRRRQHQTRIPVVQMEMSAIENECMVVEDTHNFEMAELVPMIDELLADHPDDTKRDKRNKRILVEYYLKERTMREIGCSMRMSRQAVYQAIKRGIFLLRVRFKDLTKDWS